MHFKKHGIRWSLFLCAAMVSLGVSAEQRSGFYLSGGIGGHRNNILISDPSVTYYDQNFNGLQTSFKIGGYLNPNFSLYYHREALFFKDNTDARIISGLSGIGGTYYFDREGGLYIETGLGISDLSDNTNNVSWDNGGAFLLGFGSELTPHIQFGGNLMYGVTTSPYDATRETEVTSLGFKVEFKL